MKYRFTVQQLEAMASNPWLTDREKQVFELFYRRGREIERIAPSALGSYARMNLLSNVAGTMLNLVVSVEKLR